MSPFPLPREMPRNKERGSRSARRGGAGGGGGACGSPARARGGARAGGGGGGGGGGSQWHPKRYLLRQCHLGAPKPICPDRDRRKRVPVLRLQGHSSDQARDPARGPAIPILIV